jgi:hypothetical protein
MSLSCHFATLTRKNVVKSQSFVMFVLNPDGSLNDGSSGPSGSVSQLTPLQQNIIFFGQLSLYFVFVRGAYWYMAGDRTSSIALST